MCNLMKQVCLLEVKPCLFTGGIVLKYLTVLCIAYFIVI